MDSHRDESAFSSDDSSTMRQLSFAQILSRRKIPQGKVSKGGKRESSGDDRQGPHFLTRYRREIFG